ncbi:unnamed protein product, partial [Nesidiocoris tenuis]
HQYKPFFSKFDSSMPSIAILDAPTSNRRSQAADFCLTKGSVRGDSRTGSIGSICVIKWMRTQSLGSSTSTTDN